MSAKSVIRREVKAAVKALPCDDKTAESAAICSALYLNGAIKNAKVVALFSPLPDEPDISSLIALMAQHCKVLLPRICGDEMDFYEYTPGSLAVGSYGINEPQGGHPALPSSIDVLVLPGVAFTSSGKRLGRGKGYYDKYMSREGFRAYKIGVCYSAQLLPELPTEQHDILLDSVVSAL